jgi:hypothetical protein
LRPDRAAWPSSPVAQLRQPRYSKSREPHLPRR